MHFRGDYYTGCRVAGSFTTVTTGGVASSLTGTSGALCIVAYKLLPADATGFACSSAGITLTMNCGGRTGWNTWAVNTGSDTTFYSCGHDFELVLNHGVVNSVCVTGYLVASFSLLNRSGLVPQDNGRRLTV